MTSVPILRRFSPFRAARDEYLLTLETEDRAPATIAKYRQSIARFERFAGEVDPSAIDTTLLRRWVVQLRTDGLSTTTQRDYLNWVKTWLKWLAEEGGYGVEVAATARAKPPRVIQEPIVPLTDAEIKKLFAACSTKTFRGQRLRTTLAILLDTGIRAQEIRGLRVRDVDMDAGEITVIPATDKTRKGRTIALGKRARVEVSRWWSRFRFVRDFDAGPDAALIVTEAGTPYKDRAFKLIIARLGDRAGTSHLHPHRFRHTFAILSLKAGMDPFVLMATLGHKDMAMTKKYINFVGLDVRDQKRASSPLDNMKI